MEILSFEYDGTGNHGYEQEQSYQEEQDIDSTLESQLQIKSQSDAIYFEGYIEIIVSNNNPELSTRKPKSDKNGQYYQGKCNFKGINNPIQRCLESQKLFHLAGGYLIEFLDENGLADRNNSFLNHCKVVSSSTMYKNGSVSFSMGCLEIVHDFNLVIKLLMSKQNQEDYEVATVLTNLQQCISLIRYGVEKLFVSYEISVLENMIIARKRYIQQYRDHFIDEYLQKDDFYQIISYCLNYEVKSPMLTDHQLSSCLISLLGTSSQELINYVMRKTLFWLFSKKSRRRFMIGSMFLMMSERQLERIHESESYDAELITIDGIVIKSACKVYTIPIQYPPQLQFTGENAINKLNQLDYLVAFKYDISIINLKQVLQTREAIINSKQTRSSYIWCDLDDFIADNFEYYMQNFIFLEKYYNKKVELEEQRKIIKQVKQNRLKNEKICNFRYIQNHYY